jgi:hypothetical protein
MSKGQVGGRAVIIRVTETEFETEDGRVTPHPIPFEEGKVPTIKEFQEWYDYWHQVLVAGIQGVQRVEG